MATFLITVKGRGGDSEKGSSISGLAYKRASRASFPSNPTQSGCSGYKLSHCKRQCRLSNRPCGTLRCSSICCSLVNPRNPGQPDCCVALFTLHTHPTMEKSGPMLEDTESAGDRTAYDIHWCRIFGVYLSALVDRATRRLHWSLRSGSKDHCCGRMCTWTVCCVSNGSNSRKTHSTSLVCMCVCVPVSLESIMETEKAGSGGVL